MKDVRASEINEGDWVREIGGLEDKPSKVLKVRHRGDAVLLKFDPADDYSFTTIDRDTVVEVWEPKDREEPDTRRTVFVRWDVTETYTANIPVPDDVTDIGAWLEDADSMLAELETNDNYQGTPDRDIVEWEE